MKAAKLLNLLHQALHIHEVTFGDLTYSSKGYIQKNGEPKGSTARSICCGDVWPHIETL